MKYRNLGGYKSINKYVNHKLKMLHESEDSFKPLFELMFSEEDNVIYEFPYGYSIRQVTYGESKDNAIEVSEKIASLNLPKHSVIAIYLDNNCQWVETFWGILRSGHHPLLLNMRLDNASLEEAIKETNCQLVITNGKKFSSSYITYDGLLAKESKAVDDEWGEEILFMSSGTSENVKICAYSAVEIKNVLAQSAYVIQANKNVKRHYKGELKLLTLLPLYHIFGFIAVYTWFSFYSRTFVGLNDLSPRTIKNTINKFKVTHIFAVPLFWQKTYEMAIKEIKKKGDKTFKKFINGMHIAQKLSKSPLRKAFSKIAFRKVREGMFGDSISIMITGGSPISKETLTFFNSIGYELTSGYGMTEIGITSVDLSSEYEYLTNASIGNPLPGVEYKINENDELLVKGNTLSKYIISNGKRYDREEYFNTRDLMKYENGRYYFLGREDDLIVTSNGENLNPVIIEERIKSSEINNVALVSNSSKEAVLLVEVNKYIKEDKLSKLDKNLKAKISSLNYGSLITKIVYIKEPFIQGDEFKINRKRLTRDYFSNKLAVVDRINNTNNLEKDDVLEKIISIVKDILVVDEVDISKDLMLDLGASSLDYFAIASSIYDEFDIVIIDDDGVKYRTIEEISNFIKEQL